MACFGDSLALPREGCCYSDTWIAKLKKDYPSVDFLCNFKGGMLVCDLLESWDYMRYAEADIVVIQEGICDCAPRYINDQKLIWKVLLLLSDKIMVSGLLWRILKLKTRRSTCTYTPKHLFADKYNIMLSDIYRNNVKKVIIIKIGHGAQSVICKSQYFNSNVDAYNQVFDNLKKIYGDKLLLVDPLNQVDEDMFVDGYHCNAKGMGFVYRDLTEVLKNCFANL